MPTKTQLAIQAIQAAAEAGKTVREARAAAEEASGLHVYAEEPLTPQTAGQAFYDSHTRTEKRAMFDIFARGSKPDKWGRHLAREFVSGFVGVA